MNSPLVRQFMLFTAVGAVGTVSHYAVLICLVQLAGVPPVTASGFGFVVGALVNYALNYRITFRSAKRHQEAALKFFGVAVVGLMVNTAIMALATKVLNIDYLLSQVLATGLVLFLNFAGNRLWTFRNAGARGKT